jgi:hypothetical protein
LRFSTILDLVKHYDIFYTSKMDYIPGRFPAPRQAKLAKEQGGALMTDVQFELSQLSKLTKTTPAWFKSPARRRLYSLLFPAAVLS